MSSLTFIGFSSTDQAGPLQSAGRVRERHQPGIQPPQWGDFISDFGERQLGGRQRHWEENGCGERSNTDVKKRSRLAAQLTLFGLNLVGDGVPACGQRGREEDVIGGPLVIRVGEAGLSAPAAQGLVRKGALQRSPWRLNKREVKKMGS